MTTIFVYEDVTATWAIGDAQSPIAPSLLAEGRAMRDAVAADLSAIPDVHVVGELPFLEQAATADFTLLIAPETGGRLEHLAREVIRVGGKLLGPSPDAIRLTSDKLALGRHWESHGVPTPRTWPLGEEPIGERLIIKLRDGAGSQGIFLPPLRFGEEVQEMIAQEFVVGFTASVAFLIGEAAIIPLVPCQQLLSDDGRFRYVGGRLPIEKTLAERAVRIATEAIAALMPPRLRLGLEGYVGVDVILGDDGRDWAIEVNPRLTTSYVGLRALARFNLAEAMLKVAWGDAVSHLEWHARSIEFMPNGRVAELF